MTNHSQATNSALDLFGNITTVEPTREERVKQEVSRYGVGHDCVGCDKWLISGEETFVHDTENGIVGLLCVKCCITLGYQVSQCRNKRKRKTPPE